jgi:hypothetical protein
MFRFCQNERQPSCQNGAMTMAQVLENIGAGEGNRTLVISLEGSRKSLAKQWELRLFARQKRADWGKS